MTEKNLFHAPIKSEGASVPIEQHRAIQEVQAAMIIAKKFPRDQHAAYSRIMTACERPVLARVASYDYPKGKTMVTGPTIRLAEVLAQNWGNMEFGIKELSQGGGESEIQAFAWDLETNVRQSKTFCVPHKMKAHGSFKILTDPRDIYEHVANMGARRLRACILGIIPCDIVDAAVIKCEETLVKGDGKPIEDRIRGMLEKFKEIEISQELIEKRLQHKTTAIMHSQLVGLGKIYNSIKDGMSQRSDWFEVPGSQQEFSTSDLADKIKQKAEEMDQKEEAGKEDKIDSIDKQKFLPDNENHENLKAAIETIHGIDFPVNKVFNELTNGGDAGIFWRMKEKGLAEFFDTFENMMNTWPKEIRDFIMAKCKNIARKYPEFMERFNTAMTKEPEKSDGVISKVDNDEDWNGLYYDCPNMDGKPIPRIACKNCDRREGCPMPFIPKQAK